MSLRSLVSEFLFAVPDNKVGWRHTAARAAEKFIREFGSEVIFSSGPPFSSHLAALDASRRTGVPLVLDFRDPWSRDPWGRRGRSRASKMRHIAMERACVREASRIVLNTERMADEFRQHYSYLPAEKFICIPNGYDDWLLGETPALATNDTAKRPGHVTRILHPGSLYGQRNPTLLLQAIRRLRETVNEPIEFVQIGGCDSRLDMAQKVRQLGLEDCVHVLPAVSHREVCSQMADADILVVIQHGTSLQVPGKFFEMLGFRKPILAVVDEGATADLVQKYQVGFVAPSDSLDRTASALLDAVTAARSGTLQANFEAAIADLDGRKQAKRLAQVFEMVSRRSAGQGQADR
jgi:glycosyltransferase involved in cell wall biosynthesis